MLQKLCSCGALIPYGKSRCTKCAGGHNRNKEHDKFRNSATWRNLADWVRQRDGNKCADCGITLLEIIAIQRQQKQQKGKWSICLEVDHIIPIDTPEGWARRLDPTNCQTRCTRCHNARHGRFAPGPRKKV